MVRRSLFWKLFPTYLVVIMLCVVGVAGYAASLVWGFYHDQTERQLLATAHLVEQELSEEGGKLDPVRLKDMVLSASHVAQARITIIDVSGRVLADSEHDLESMENHANRPEVRQALIDGEGSASHYSVTLKTDMKYVAVRHAVDGAAVGVVRVARPVASINMVLAHLYVRIGLAGLVVALIAAALASLVVGRVSRPLKVMTRGAERFARGDFSLKVFVPDIAETAALAESLNHMGAQLDEKLDVLGRQTAQQEAVFSSMTEGVLAVDGEGRIITMNRSAGQMLNTDPELVRGRTLEEVIRTAGVHRFVSGILSGLAAGEHQVITLDDEDRILDARGTVLRDGAGATLGVLIVLSDLTRINRLENMRRDFVANVSHELKTPITSIKGFVETLREGGLEDRGKALEFLEILSRHADRLDALIDDLLSLSRIEREAERGEVQFASVNLKDVLTAAVSDCAGKAEQGHVGIEVRCPEDLVLELNPQLMEQAVLNLLDNAVKYSPSGSTVILSVDRVGCQVRIDVRDVGCGIALEHLGRVFERFYRVDKARSRKLGGTGLGLSIVKHIVQAHHGVVSVESTPGKGSTFSIFLPAK
jgi:two-component system, OmpR family, phosphate regulon sensor histidine kinase PhoR